MTRHILLVPTMLSLPLLLAASAHKQPLAPTLTTDPLPAAQVAIYRDFLANYVADPAHASESINLQMETEPFTPSSNMDPDMPCLSADDIGNLNTPHLHKFAPGTFTSSRVHVIDLSEPTPVHTTHSFSMPVPFTHHKAQTVADTPPPQVAAPRPAALFTLSEIVFNKAHTLAAFHYSYMCGDSCGHGATVFYELHGGSWHASRAGCSKWVI